jgi:peptide chain release factor 1
VRLVTGFEPLDLIDERPGFLVFRASGPHAEALFRDEAGGHRWQRVPPSEKRGRVHTSTVTVAVLPEPTEVQVRLAHRDLAWRTCKASGAGGQDGQVNDHVTGRRWSLEEYLRGEW